MKLFLPIFILLMTFSTYAQQQAVNLSYWDGTFAYNQLAVQANERQSYLTIEMKGATLGIGSQLEATNENWGQNNVKLYVSRKNCQINKDLKEIDCEVEKQNITIQWEKNFKISKIYSGLVKNLKLKASKTGVTLSFHIQSDKYFSPAKNDILAEFSVRN